MTNPDFWNKIARKYAATPVRNEANYQITLDDIRHHLKQTDKVLEIGCGTGSTAITLCPNVSSYLATDYAPSMIEIANEKKKKLDPTQRHLEFAVVNNMKDIKADHFDVVLALNLLHLVKDLNPMLQDIHKTLKTSGLFVSKSGCLSGWKKILKLPIGLMQLLNKAPYVAFRSPKDFENAFQDAGFEIVKSIAIPKGSMNRYIIAKKI